MKGENVQAVLDRADHGTFMNDANTEFEKVVRAVRETLGKGSVTIKINIQPVKNKTDGALELRAELDSKIPRPGHSSDLWFSDEEGQVSRKHPGQPDLPGTEPKQTNGLAADEVADEDGVVTKLRK